MARRVMVVDDDDDFRGNVAETLKTYGYNVVSASNGMDCIDKLKRINVDLVLMDLIMPMMSGIDTIKAIRGDESLKGNRIVVVTFMNLDDKSVDFLHRLGVSTILFKPVEVGLLAYMIGRIIAKDKAGGAS